MREWGVDIRLFSTRPPDDASAARHAFAEQARKRDVVPLAPSLRVGCRRNGVGGA